MKMARSFKPEPFSCCNRVNLKTYQFNLMKVIMAQGFSHRFDLKDYFDADWLELFGTGICI